MASYAATADFLAAWTGQARPGRTCVRGGCPARRPPTAPGQPPQQLPRAQRRARERQEERGEEGSRERYRACKLLSDERQKPDRGFELCDRSTLTCRRKGLSVGASADCFSRKMSSAASGGVQEDISGGVVR